MPPFLDAVIKCLICIAPFTLPRVYHGLRVPFYFPINIKINKNTFIFVSCNQNINLFLNYLARILNAVD